MTWMMNGNEFELGENTHKEIYGFVYLITCKKTNKQYIGKKFFWSSKTKTIKGKKKRSKVESDWKDYFGSNKVLIEDVKVNGKDNYTREILHLCKTKGECNYLEAYEQFTRKVLIGEDYYNEWIMVKVHRSHIKGLQRA
jgi:Putative endonuclease segE, GIY-YIG domain